MNQYINFKYANSFGNRCAIFARPTGVGLKRTEVFILECSKRDPFSRRKAREVYNNYVHLGESFYTKKALIYQSFSPGSKERLVSESKEKVVCHPQIFELPLMFNNEHITKFCETFLKRWLSRQKLKEFISALEETFQIEK